MRHKFAILTIVLLTGALMVFNACAPKEEEKAEVEEEGCGSQGL